MGVRGLTCLFVLVSFFAFPFTSAAQDATVTGVVTDSTGGVLPGVTVVVVLEASGNTFEGVTDERGAYRITVRPGVLRITRSCQDSRRSHAPVWSCWSASRPSPISSSPPRRCRSR